MESSNIDFTSRIGDDFLRFIWGLSQGHGTLYVPWGLGEGMEETGQFLELNVSVCSGLSTAGFELNLDESESLASICTIENVVNFFGNKTFLVWT